MMTIFVQQEHACTIFRFIYIYVEKFLNLKENKSCPRHWNMIAKSNGKNIIFLFLQKRNNKGLFMVVELYL